MKTKEVKSFGTADKIGYMFGDFGNDFTFVLASMFLMKFYTDVMGISSAVVGLMMMLARCVDAVTDIAMGQIVDRSKPTSSGKFRPWIRRMCGAVTLASFLMYPCWFANMPLTFKTVWMFVTYILWGSICYTGVNIPYGSMASAITGNPKERAVLSKWRTIGATLASAVIGVILPLTVYYTDEAGNKVLSGPKMTIGALICSLLALICYLICYQLTTERIKVEQITNKFNLKELLVSLGSNRSLIAIILSTIFLMVAQGSLTGLAGYIFPNYFANTKAQSASTLAGVIVTLVCSVFIVRLTEKFGRRELGIGASLFSSIILVLTLILHTHNAWFFVLLYALIYSGYGLFALMNWAMITDVIDDTEIVKGERSDGTVYSLYSFSRKLGQALATGIYGAMLSVIGYTQATAFDTAVTNGIYSIFCLIPLAGFLLVACILKFLYPLTKARVEKNAEILAEKRKNNL